MSPGYENYIVAYFYTTKLLVIVKMTQNQQFGPKLRHYGSCPTFGGVHRLNWQTDIMNYRNQSKKLLYIKLPGSASFPMDYYNTKKLKSTS